MGDDLRTRLIALAYANIANDDPSHDVEHARRVLANAERIAAVEGGDLDIIVPAALFHDVVNPPKDDPRAAHASDASADWITASLPNVSGYPTEKIPRVADAIRCCSFAKGIRPAAIEAQILQDADGLEATGAVAIMRTFASTGQMRRPFYRPADPLCATRAPDPKRYALDLFFARLLVVRDRMHTATARQLAEERTQFLRVFLDQFARELSGA